MKKIPEVFALVQAARQVVSAAEAMENGGRGVDAATRAHLAMVKAEGELLLAEALARLGDYPQEFVWSAERDYQA